MFGSALLPGCQQRIESRCNNPVQFHDATLHICRVQRHPDGQECHHRGEHHGHYSDRPLSPRQSCSWQAGKKPCHSRNHPSAGPGDSDGHHREPGQCSGQSHGDRTENCYRRYQRTGHDIGNQREGCELWLKSYDHGAAQQLRRQRHGNAGSQPPWYPVRDPRRDACRKQYNSERRQDREQKPHVGGHCWVQQ